MVLHEATRTGGFGGEVAAEISENMFASLDAPVLRTASLDTPVPFNRLLEEQFMPRTRLENDLKRLMAY